MSKKTVLIIIVAISLSGYLHSCKSEDKKPVVEEKQKPVTVSKYSPAFVTSVNKALADYYGLTEAFVNWDSTAIRNGANALQTSFNGISFEEVKKDTAIYVTATSYLENFKGDLQAIKDQPNITDKRQSFNSLSQNIYDLLRTIKYDGAPVYKQECPMAFNDTDPGTWLSKTSAVRNPYLGLHHPKYKSGMLTCGDTKDSLHY